MAALNSLSRLITDKIERLCIKDGKNISHIVPRELQRIGEVVGSDVIDFSIADSKLDGKNNFIIDKLTSLQKTLVKNTSHNISR